MTNAPPPPLFAQPPLAELNERSREIFRRLVDQYLTTGEPVGSRNLSRALSMSLSPASVRNVMHDLEHAGLIYSPHTSAGRLPTQSGLRFFVDAMMEVGDLTEDERRNIEAQVATGQTPGRTFDAVLNDATALLSGLSRSAAVVATTANEIKLKHIEFVRLDADRGLVVLVGDDGNVENRIVPLPPGLPPSALQEATNYLNHQLRGFSIADARRAQERLVGEIRRELDSATQRVVEAGLASWAGEPGSDTGKLIVHGRASLLENLTALEDLERARRLFEDLERQKDIVDLLTATERGEGVRIFIGSENKLFSLSGSSLVAAPFRDRDQKIVGVLGVIGPTRLNYARIVPMVDYTAKVVGRMLGGG
jgi:heat-inducible transcriptional repressor